MQDRLFRHKNYIDRQGKDMPEILGWIWGGRVNEAALIATAAAVLSGGRGLRAMDESTGTCNKRLLAAGMPATLEKPASRRSNR